MNRKQQPFLSSVTSKIIIINVAVYVIMLLMSILYGELFVLELFALQPSAILGLERLWTILTSMFAHVAFMHLFVNMFSLYFLGTFVERLIGKKRFIIFYLTSGVIAGLFMVVLSGFFAVNPLLARVLGDPGVYALGASGALFGLVGILAVLTPHVRVFFLAGPLVAFIALALLPATAGPLVTLLSLLVTVYLFASIFFLMSFNPRYTRLALPIELSMWVLPILAIVPLMIISVFVDLPIGNTAHFGGLLVGLVYASYLRRRYPKRSKMIARMFT